MDSFLKEIDTELLKRWLLNQNEDDWDVKEVNDNIVIETKYGLGTIRNLSSGCKTLLNIVKHPDKVVNVEECGPNVLRIIFTMDNIRIYMSRPTLFDIPDDAKINVLLFDILFSPQVSTAIFFDKIILSSSTLLRRLRFTSLISAHSSVPWLPS